MKQMMKRLAAALLVLAICCGCAFADEPVQAESMDAIRLLCGEGLLQEDQAPMYYRDHEAGHWLFVSSTVRVEIHRYTSASPQLTWYLADLQMAEGVSLYTLSAKDMTGKQNDLPQRIASKGRAVYAQNGDFYTYRVSHDRYAGIIIRGGKVLYKKSYSKMVHALPNLATMAFYPSGRAEVNEAWEVTAKEYQERGASTVVAFGPILIRGGEVQDLSDAAYKHREPRSCFGIVGTGHYVGLLVEGRSGFSEGATLEECAAILEDYGCWDAFNLDGGGTSAMLFMGESVMQNSAGGVYQNDRSIPDVLCVGGY